MSNTDHRERLQLAPENVKTNPDGSEYIPIGFLEQQLDFIYGAGNWGMWNYTFNILPVERDGVVSLIASGSGLLEVKGDQPMTGAHTMVIDPMDSNTNYSGTTLSYCIANAAKKKGVVFGRALNRRLEIGETGDGSDIQRRQDKKQEHEDETTRHFIEVKEKMVKAKTKAAAEKIMNDGGFKFNTELKQILLTKTK